MISIKNPASILTISLVSIILTVAHIHIRILQTMVSGIPRVLGLKTRMQTPYQTPDTG